MLHLAVARKPSLIQKSSLWLCVLLLGFNVKVGAAETASQLFSSGVTAFRADQLQRARSLFVQAEEAGLQAARLYYNLGVVNYRLGDYPVAEGYFLRVADFESSRQIAHYNLARCAQAQQQLGQARIWYQRAQQGQNARIAGLARRAIKQLSKVADAAWQAHAQVAVGFDTAVVGLTDQVTALPTRIADVFQESQLGLRYNDLELAEGELHAQLNLYQLAYESVEQADIQSLQGGLQWQGERSAGRKLGWQMHVAHEWLDSQEYQLRAGLGGRYEHAWRQLWLRYSLDGEWYEPQSSALQGIGGSRFDLAVTTFGRWMGGLGFVRLFGQFNQRRDDSNSPRRYGLRLYWASPQPGIGWSWQPSLQWRVSRYPDDGVPRERRLRARLRFDDKLNAQWHALLDVEYERNYSVLDSRAYAHTRLMMGLRWENL